MSSKPTIIAMDLEGVLVPEVWIAVAERTRIEKLRLTTRDVPDYDALMRGRLAILDQHGLKLRDIQAVIGTMDPLPGALDFVRRLRARLQLVILSDTYYEFARPLMQKLEWPTLFCNSLEVDGDGGRVLNYHLRVRDGKKHAVLGLKQLGFHVIAVGDSYNDTNMLAVADLGVLFRPSATVRRDFPQFPVVETYEALDACIEQGLRGA